jgi:YebC/PmpR family DNA-binding regulatory protein
MSGHSKWSTIKRQKGLNDAKRGASFTKMGMAIAIAAREGGGGDPASNFKLRLAMDQARAMNMPKENVQRAIDRGLGKGGVAAIETVVYEGYGPAKVSLIVIAATDNKNRTTPEVRSTIEKSGGTFATLGAVDWAFVDMGMITVEKGTKSLDELFEIAADAGADDIDDLGDFVEVYTKPTEVEKVKNVLIEKGLTVGSFEIFKKPTTLVEIKDAETAKKVLALIEKIEDLDDVQKVYANFNISDNLLEEIQG